MRIAGVVRSPLITDYGRWRRVIFQSPTAMSFQRMDDTFQGFPAKIDAEVKTLTLTGGDKGSGGTFAIARPDAGQLILDGELNGHKMRLDLRLFERERFLLVSRGFNWIQERPFNR